MDAIRTAAKLSPRIEIRSLRVARGYALGVYEDGKLVDACCEVGCIMDAEGIKGPRDAEQCILTGSIWHHVYSSARRLRCDHARAEAAAGRRS